MIEGDGMALLHQLLDSIHAVEFPKVRLRNMIQGIRVGCSSAHSECIYGNGFVRAGQDTDGSGALDYEEFVALVNQMKKVLDDLLL